MNKVPTLLNYLGAAALLIAITACQPPTNDDTQAMQDEAQATSGDEAQNPFFTPSTLPFAMPPFDKIKDSHFKPAMEKGMQERLAEIDAIVNNPEPATFENTIVAMEKGGQILGRTLRVFSNLNGADSNPERREIQREMSPVLSAHNDAIQLNPALFARIDTLYQNRAELSLTPEQMRVLERYHQNFVRAGARLAEEQKVRLREINTRLANLGTNFSQNVLSEVNASALIVDSAEELAGLSDAEIQAAADEAASRDMPGKFVLTLKNTSGQPPLSSLENRNTRERLHKASLTRGGRGGEFDNREIIAEIMQLRAERAQLLGYNTHADFILEVQTAGSVATVQDLLGSLGPIAVANARKEAQALQTMINQTEETPFELASWDWAYYTEKVRQEKYDFDDNQIRPYFELESVLTNGVFYAANQLFGISFTERPDLPTYHPDARVWEVTDANGEPLGLFIGDFYARASKRGGAWMNSYVLQSDLMGTRPVVGNHQNIPKPPAGQPTLMTLTEVTTMFHEFGHAVHGLFSDVTYPSVAATAVPRDFVEYPSQINEMWVTWPSILANYAIHNETGEQIPQALLDRVIEASQFNEGFRSSEYLKASILDMCYHTLTAKDLPAADDILAFEANCLEQAGVAFAPVPPRYRTTYFSHIMGGYSAGYYSYIWSEVLDADSVRYLEENGGLTRENGDHLRKSLLSRGGSVDAMQQFEDLVGRAPDIQPLLERRGLTSDGSGNE
ncbi:M3 family metallopeptidase [Glaciecola sp. SC05]|uniref:M3 family metallopeptidase n=1 Tax=Glaciecola sp. SC05 TaxID=1987355 RepID=UPI003527FF86